ncbi:MAG: alpha/beta fold hydrolase [Alphaproteobacteria bacterium]
MKFKLGIFLCVLIVVFIIAQHAGAKRLLPPFYKMEDNVEAVKSLKDFKTVQLTINNSPLHLVHTGSQSAPAVLFIHGSPGSWEAWAQYLHDPQLREQALIIAVDRPAYGGSNNGTYGKSLKEQSHLVMSALKEAFPNHKEFIVVGHSYGGPIALRIAIDYPKSVKSMLLLAPAISPDLVRVKWYNRLAKLLVVRLFLSTPLIHSNKEMIPLKAELKIMKPFLEQIKAPVNVLQGAKDWIVEPGNATYAKETIINAPVKTTLLPENGHFLPWEEYPRIKKMIIQQIQKSDK